MNRYFRLPDLSFVLEMLIRTLDVDDGEEFPIYWFKLIAESLLSSWVRTFSTSTRISRYRKLAVFWNKSVWFFLMTQCENLVEWKGWAFIPGRWNDLGLFPKTFNYICELKGLYKPFSLTNHNDLCWQDPRKLEITQHYIRYTCLTLWKLKAIAVSFLNNITVTLHLWTL